MRIDHLIYGVGDLHDAAARLLDEHGLQSFDGGRHPGHGTGNRIVPLGSQYIELLAVVDPVEARASPLGQTVAMATAARDQLIGWAVAADEIESHAQRLSIPVQTMSRDLPTGGELHWDVAGVEHALAHPELPFFIRWHDPDLHPGRLGAADAHAGQVESIELDVDPTELYTWLGDGADLPIRIIRGPLGGATLLIGGREIRLQ